MELPKPKTKVSTVDIQAPRVEDAITLEQVFDASPVFPQTDTVPTGVPRNWWQRIQRYVNGSTRRLYIYDEVNNSWHYTTLT